MLELQDKTISTGLSILGLIVYPLSTSYRARVALNSSEDDFQGNFRGKSITNASPQTGS